MDSPAPVDVALAFLGRINAHDVEGLCALMTEDHILMDGLGARSEGREMMRKGWSLYFSCFPDYRVSHEDVLSRGSTVLLTGSAEGTFAREGKLPAENHGRVPAAWKAVVRVGRIAEWHVYADNQPARKIMGWDNP